MDRTDRKLREISEKLNYIMLALNVVWRKEVEIMADLTELAAQVKTNTDAEESAILLIQGLAAQIIAAGTDQVALKKLSDDLKASADALAAAVVANTPAAPEV